MLAKRILVTNDDGIEAEGLKALERSLESLGEVVVVAPEHEMSATSQSLSLHSPLRVRAIDERHYAVAGTPADAVILALHRLLATRPDLVVSGVNPGGNLGENIVYSGTVAAAMEAALHGVPAFAISLASRKDLDFSAAASFAFHLAAKVLAEGLPAGVVLNVNVPRGEVRGVRFTRQSRGHVGLVGPARGFRQEGTKLADHHLVARADTKARVPVLYKPLGFSAHLR